jgi:hypothetical protein
VTKRRRRAKTVRSAQRRPSLSRSVLLSAREAASSPSASPSIRESIADLLPRLAMLSVKLHVGFGVLAKYAHDADLATEAGALAAAHRAIADEVVELALSLGIETPRIKSTCGERLRWEWLVSSARLTDGAPDSQLIAECTRLQREVAAAAEVAAVGADAAEGASSASEMRQIHTELARARGLGERLASRDEASHRADESRAFAFSEA